MRFVLKFGGTCLSRFPHRAAILCSLGRGYFKKYLTTVERSRNFCNWLDKWRYYRPDKEIKQVSYPTYQSQSNWKMIDSPNVDHTSGLAFVAVKP